MKSKTATILLKQKQKQGSISLQHLAEEELAAIAGGTAKKAGGTAKEKPLNCDFINDTENCCRLFPSLC